MLKQRRQAAEVVATEFLKTEEAIDSAAQMAASCVTAMLVQRAEANLPVNTGLNALQLIADASADLIRARQRIIEAHGALLTVRTEIGLGGFDDGYGDESKCPPNTGTRRRGDLVKLVA